MTFSEQLQHTPQLIQVFLLGVGIFCGLSVTAAISRVIYLRADLARALAEAESKALKEHIEQIKAACDGRVAFYKAMLSFEREINVKLMESMEAEQQRNQAIRKELLKTIYKPN